MLQQARLSLYLYLTILVLVTVNLTQPLGPGTWGYNRERGRAGWRKCGWSWREGEGGSVSLCPRRQLGPGAWWWEEPGQRPEADTGQRDGVPGVHVGGGTGFWARCLGAGHDAVRPSVGIGMNPYGDALRQRVRALGEVLEALGMVLGCYERCFWCWAWMQVRPQCGLA